MEAQSQSVSPTGTVALLASDGTAVLHAPSFEKHKTILTMQKGKGNLKKDKEGGSYQSSNVKWSVFPSKSYMASCSIFAAEAPTFGIRPMY